MATLTLGKVKLVNRGQWSGSATYTQGDVVNFGGNSYVYKNETSKQYTSLFQGGTGVSPTTGVFTGVISSLAANAFSCTITWDVALQATNDNRITIGNMYVYNQFFEPDAKILSITNTNTTTSVITLDKESTNNTTQSSVRTVVGTRRMAGKYEVALNDTDWDMLSEGITFQGAWSYTTPYLPGNLVVRNNNSYLCIHGNDGVDPLFDYIGAWEPYLVGDDALPHNRVVTPVNANPWGWRGHPYIPLPTWNNATTVNATAMIAGTTYTIVTVGTTTFTNHGASRNAAGVQFVATSTGTGNGTVACTYSGIPWNIPASHKDPITNSLAQAAPFWNTPSPRNFMDYRGAMNYGSDGRGNRLSSGHNYYGSAPGQSGSYRYHTGETAAQFFNDYYTDEVKQYGNQNFAWNMQRGSAPRLTQNTHRWTTRFSLTSYGSVLATGTSSGSNLGGEDTDFVAPLMELGRADFNNRAIVKIAIPDASRDSNEWALVLDEHGEVWTWGYNGYGHLGIGPENHLATGFRLANRTDNVRSPMCLTKEIFFEGNRIVDVFRMHFSSFALDELGQLWAWGRNNYGQLGYQSASGFANTGYVSAPFKIPVVWSTYGGIQKIFTCGTENEDWLMILDGQGHVWTQGYNNVGQLGKNSTTSDSNSTGTITRTSQVNSWSIGGGVRNIWANGNQNQLSYFLNSSNQLFMCGYNSHNQFGSANTTNRLIPELAGGPKGAMTDIVCFSGSGRAGGGSQTCLDNAGISYGTGWNGYGETGIGFITSYPGNNAYPQQQFGTVPATTGWQRVIMPSHMYQPGSRIMDIWGYGDYDGATSHITNHFWLTERGELLQSGRAYNYSTASHPAGSSTQNQQYAPVSPASLL
jgi:alpha-tubulin suppressor-like RCC1 family protein